MSKKQEKAIKRAHEALDKFLDGFNESEGGYAPFSKKEEDLFHSLMDALIEAKFSPDPDGDYPLEYFLINRTKQERMHFFVQEYLYRATEEGNKKAILRYLELAYLNANMAHTQIDQAVRALMELERNED